MKPNKVRLGVQKSSNVRPIGMAPNLGRLWRMTGTSTRDGQLVDPRRQRQQELQRSIVIGWSIALGILAIAVVAVVFVVWMRPILARAKDTTERDREAKEGRARKVSRFASPTKEEALALVQEALAERNPNEVERVIRPGSMTTQQVVDYLAAMKEADGEIKDYFWLSNVDKNGLLLEGVQVVFEKRDRLRSRWAFLTPDEKGLWKLDFAAFARSVTPSWETLLEQPSGVGVVRVYTGQDRYYNGPFAEGEWVAYGMGSEDIDVSLYGYCKRGSLQQRAMDLMISAAENSLARATLEVRKIAGADRRQFEITRVLAEDWVMGEEAFDTTVK